MAVPRPVLFALLGLAVCAAAFLATRSARDPGGAVTSTPATAAPAVEPAAPEAGSAPAAKPGAREDGKSASPGTSKPEAPAVPPAAAAKAAAVKSALDRGDAVVFFFTHPGAADDTGTRQAVNALAGADRVTVVRAGLKQLSTYRPVLAGAGVSQVPAVVVAHADKPARLLEGYVDGRTLRQTVADALR